MTAIQRRLRFGDLLALNIVSNRATLRNWISKRGFPTGQLTGPNLRTWGEQDVLEWLQARPSKPKVTPVPKRTRGRPRKHIRADAAMNP
jgi:predicted DNA-binding transcriptional regulator AlpA